MAINLSNLANRLFNWERYRDGTTWMSLDGSTTDWNLGDYFECVNKNPVLFRVIDIIADAFSLCEFTIDGEEDSEHPLIKLLNDPNYPQSKQTFLKEYIFQKLCYGYVYQKPIAPEGFRLDRIESLDSIYNLSSKGISYDKRFATRLLNRQAYEDINQKQFKYKESEQEHLYNVGDVIPFFDSANGLGDDFMLKAKSRLNSIEKPIKNIDTALCAENRALLQLGVWIISGSNKGGTGIMTGFKPDEKREMEQAFSSFGLGQSRKNFIVTPTNVETNSLHTNMKDLGLSEVIMNNANLIMNCFGIPKEIYSIDKSGSTFENQKEAYINFIQNVVQPEADSFCNSYNSYFELDKKLGARFDHLAVMQHIEDMKAKKALNISQVFRNAGSEEVGMQILEIAGINTDEEDG